MEYGGMTRDEMEVTIRLERETRQAHICSTWPEWSRKLERLYGAPTRTSKGQDGRIASAFWTVPIALVTLRKGTIRRRPLTEQERRVVAARFQKARSSRP